MEVITSKDFLSGNQRKQLKRYIGRFLEEIKDK